MCRSSSAAVGQFSGGIGILNRLFSSICGLTALLLLLTGCSGRTSYEDFYGGTPLDSDSIRSASVWILSETEKKETVVTDASGIRMYFWTEGGEVYHSTPACSRLASAKTVLSGSVDSAALAGKDRGCSVCCK